jgi:hypothetical protein
MASGDGIRWGSRRGAGGIGEVGNRVQTGSGGCCVFGPREPGKGRREGETGGVRGVKSSEKSGLKCKGRVKSWRQPGDISHSLCHSVRSQDTLEVNFPCPCVPELCRRTMRSAITPSARPERHRSPIGKSQILMFLSSRHSQLSIAGCADDRHDERSDRRIAHQVLPSLRDVSIVLSLCGPMGNDGTLDLQWKFSTHRDARSRSSSRGDISRNRRLPLRIRGIRPVSARDPPVSTGGSQPGTALGILLQP